LLDHALKISRCLHPFARFRRIHGGERQGSRSTEEQAVNLLASMLFVWGSVAALSIAAAVLIVLGEVRLDALADLGRSQ
jgi:hypothetical protein